MGGKPVTLGVSQVLAESCHGKQTVQGELKIKRGWEKASILEDR